MKTVNQIDIQAPARAVFDLAQDVARWPSFLAHYRWVKVLQERAGFRLVEMAAKRNRLPCWWQSEQRRYPGALKVHYRHTRGWTKGMEVWWILKKRGPRACRVLLTHDLRDPPDPLRRWFYQTVVGDFFVHYIADQTLAGLKRRAESGRATRQA